MSAIGQAYRELDHYSRQHYGITGDVLLAKLEKGESGGRRNAVSNAGARAWFQFMPGTRQAVVQKFGIDPWRSEHEARDAAVLHLTGKLGNAPGLEGFNPGGGRAYVRYVLGQKVGHVTPSRIPGSAPSVGGVSGTGVNPTQPFSPGSGSQALAALLGAATGPQHTPPPVTLAPPPAFAASAAMPAGYQAPEAGAPPAPKPTIDPAQLQALTDLTLPKIRQPTAQGGGGGSPATPGTPLHKVQTLFERAAVIDREHLPYKWGGGHGPTPAKPGVPVDCSGAVSRLLGVNPRVSGQFESFGRPGRGKGVTIYANAKHVLMEINGHFWGTSATNPGGGAGWIPRSAISPQYLRNFTARHPAGM